MYGQKNTPETIITGISHLFLAKSLGEIGCHYSSGNNFSFPCDLSHAEYSGSILPLKGHPVPVFHGFELSLVCQSLKSTV